jgi:hypothetical protein
MRASQLIDHFIELVGIMVITALPELKSGILALADIPAHFGHPLEHAVVHFQDKYLPEPEAQHPPAQGVSNKVKQKDRHRTGIIESGEHEKARHLVYAQAYDKDQKAKAVKIEPDIFINKYFSLILYLFQLKPPFILLPVFSSL